MIKNTVYGIILALVACGAHAAVAGEAPDRLAWFRDAKFGMFVHWGPYSALGGEWKGRAVPTEENAEWIMHFFRIPAAEYRAAARRFNPTKFDAQAWAHLASQAGMKYLVVTAKHHDGFAMYRSAVSKYNIADWTPFARDPLAELAEACRREGIRFCVYYSHREDWDDPDAYGNDWDYDDSKKDFARYLEQKSKPQVRELLSRYGPLGLIWFDRGLYTPAQAQDFVNLVRSMQPDCLVNGRVGNYDQELMGDYQVMEDNDMPAGGLNEYWESAQTLNGTWGYSKFDHAWKTSATVVRRLVEIASKGGNYLLDLGPDPEGVFPQPAVDVLRQVGRWMDHNSESIYGTSASPFGRLPWGVCTVKGTRLYLHVFDWPKDGRLHIPGLKNTPETAYLLSARDRKLAWQRHGAEVTIQLSRLPPDDVDSVVVLELAGRPEAEPFVLAQKENEVIRLDYMFAVTTGSAAKRYNRKGAYHIAKWTSPVDSASWKVQIGKPGRFEVGIRYAARPEWDGGEFEAVIGSHTLRGTVHPTGDWFEYRVLDLGQVDFERAGEYTVTIRPTVKLSHNLMHFEALELAPRLHSARLER